METEQKKCRVFCVTITELVNGEVCRTLLEGITEVEPYVDSECSELYGISPEKDLLAVVDKVRRK